MQFNILNGHLIQFGTVLTLVMHVLAVECHPSKPPDKPIPQLFLESIYPDPCMSLAPVATILALTI